MVVLSTTNAWYLPHRYKHMTSQSDRYDLTLDPLLQDYCLIMEIIFKFVLCKYY